MNTYKVHIKPAEINHNSIITIWDGTTTINMNTIGTEVYRMIFHKQACFKPGTKELELGNLVEMIIASQNDRLNLRLAWEVINTLYYHE